MENQIKKDLENLKETIDELLDDRKIVFNAIAELYDIIQEWCQDDDFILQELANIQQYAK